MDLYGYGPYVEENYIPKVSKNYYVTIIIGENIKKAEVEDKINIISWIVIVISGKIARAIAVIAAPIANHIAKRPAVNISIMANTTAMIPHVVSVMKSPLSFQYKTHITII